MKNQINMINQDTQQIDQNPISEPIQIPEKPKVNYFMIIGIILVCLLAFGMGGYYLGSRSVSEKTKPIETLPTPTGTTATSLVTSPTSPVTSPINKQNSNASLKTYKNVQYKITFNYPQNYIISTNTDCSDLINNQADCLLSLTLSPTKSSYPPKAHFWLLKGINRVNIPGQVNNISFDLKKRVWVINNPVPPSEGLPTLQVLPVWDRTKSGQEIIKASNGGSHSSSYYYIIPDYQKNEVAIFSIPQSYRLQCDRFINDKPKETDCNNFYTSVINQYNKGQPTPDNWLPEDYLTSLYSEAENIVKSYTREAIK